MLPSSALFAILWFSAATAGADAVPAEARYDSLIAATVAEVGGPYPVPPALVKAVMRQESSFRTDAVSRAGARGLMQVMPGTAVRVGVRAEDLFDPAQNIRAGVRLLSTLLEHYRGDVISSLVAYNARPRALFAPIPRNGETPDYVWKVLANYERYSRSAAAASTAPSSAPAPSKSGGGPSLPFMRSVRLP